MRSEEEIRHEIEDMIIREKLLVEKMDESFKDGDHHMVKMHMQEANSIQSRRLALQWVLTEI